MARYWHPLTGAFPGIAKADKDAGVYPDYPFIEAGSQHNKQGGSSAFCAACYANVVKGVTPPEKIKILHGNIFATRID
ncbi:hypothetical protein [Atlantibacter sp.]|uniref:hypothetical protein n=1 Tax=Atlantibacter sp. TaxID=1903473 RepID=UPI0028B19051|nr:hypothetical protein [Atlantibacter sp.]